MSSVVVVGAGLGAIRLAESLRANGFDGTITLVGAEKHPPYDRPPLSKTVLLGTDNRVDLKPADYYTEQDIALRLSTRVTAVRPAANTIAVESVPASGDAGSTDEISYDTLVLATGLRPRRFPGTEGMSGVHVLRTYDDALAIRAQIEDADNAVVIGAGFIGCEVAASLTTRGVHVSLVEPAPAPLAAALGAEIGDLVARTHTDNGVDVRTGVGVAEIVAGGDGSVGAVRLDDGTELPADLVVAGIGSTPEVGFLDGSGIELADPATGGGIACDPTGHTSAADVYALGDVANWSDGSGVARRVEHWNHVVEQAAIVARRIVGGSEIAPAVPYFWSDQFNLKLQVLGSPRADDTVHLVSQDAPKFLAYFSRDGILTGVAGVGKAGAVMKTRSKLLTPTPIGDVL